MEDKPPNQAMDDLALAWHAFVLELAYTLRVVRLLDWLTEECMTAHLRYLSYVLRHKWHVLYAGLFLGVPLWRLIIHDWSKFSRAEWGPYVRRFYGGRGSLLDKEADPVEFHKAWEHHYERNPHHPEYWYRPEEDGIMRANWMLPTYVREMVADWYGAGMAQGKPDIAAYYLANKDRYHLHPSSRYLATQVLKEAQRKGLIP